MTLMLPLDVDSTIWWEPSPITACLWLSPPFSLHGTLPLMDELVVLALISALVFSGTFRLMLPFVLLKVQSPPMADVPRIAPLVVLAVTAPATRSIVRDPLVDFGLGGAADVLHANRAVCR
ncbi:hypothetical protein VQ056_25855 [Paenibacillus sp. JTLBN-2024]